MVDYEYFDLFYKNNTNKQGRIEYSGGVMTNKELFQNSEELTESLCSEKELRFGCCEASSFKFKVANIVKPMIGEAVTFSIVIDHNESEPLLIGKYKVASDKETADRRHREVVAYDAMYDIINADMASWYNSVLPEENSTVTMKQFRESFVRYFSLTEVLPKGGLVNDDMTVQRTIQPEQISGKDVITAICEINGCFGHIGRDGKFHYIYLPQAIEGLYPANDLYPDHAPEWMAQAKTGHLYPQDPKTTRIGKGSYIPPCNYESFRTKPITKLQIRMEENDIGKIWPETPPSEKDNCYIIQDNFLVYGKSSDELSVIAQNILSKITDIIYRPFDCTAVGNPCLEVGDPIRLNTTYEIVESYILTRTMKGIQALRDTYKSNGVEKYTEEVNGVHKSIIQLKGKANILTRTIEETKLEMYDIAEGLSNTITITARDIRAELKNTADGLTSNISITAGQIRTELQNTKEGLETSISVTAGQIRTDMAATYETKSDAESTKRSLQSSIEQTANSIVSTVSATYQTKTDAGEEYKNLSTSIEQTANGIRQEVSAIYETKTDSGSKYYDLQSSIEQTESKIELKVSKGDLSSEISQEAGKIHLEADRLSWNSTYSSMEEDGTFSTSKANITGGQIEVLGTTQEETRVAVRYKDEYATEISASGISCHLKYSDGRLRQHITLGPTASYIFSPLTVGEDSTHFFYSLYVGGNKNSYISNVLELENPTVVGSDRRLKDNVRYISDSECLNNIKKLEQAEFEYIKTPGMLHHGIIAQDAQDAFWDGWSPVRTSGEYLGVAYEEIIADLIGAVKYLAKEIGA